MQVFLETLIQAMVIGSLYALIALGYTMVYGILKFINFAHSDVFVLGAWSSFTLAVFLISRLGLDHEALPWWWLGPVVLLSAMTICAAVGFTIERLAYRPLRKAPRLNVLITAIGVSLLMQNVGQLQYQVAPDLRIPFGTRPQPMPAILPQRALNATVVATGTPAPGADGAVRLEAPFQLDPDRTYQLELTFADGLVRTLPADTPREAGGPVSELRVYPSPEPEQLGPGARYRLLQDPRIPILLLDVVIVSSALLLMLGLEMLVFRTKLGTAMRAVSFNFDTAALMGINVDRVISFTFVVGAALAGGAGFLNALKYPLNISSHESWVLLGLKAFVAAVVGGIGNVRGAVLGGFLIASIEMFGKRYIDPALADVYVFTVLILVLLLRPSGLLGSTVREKV